MDLTLFFSDAIEVNVCLGAFPKKVQNNTHPEKFPSQNVITYTPKANTVIVCWVFIPCVPQCFKTN